MNIRRVLPVAALAALLAACGDAPPPADLYRIDSAAAPAMRSSLPCKRSNPQRDAFFGDTHVHTSVSTDAWMFGVRVTPDDAHRYAFGGEVQLPVEGSNERAGHETRTVRIDRPLDFVAITDHAEFLGEQALCADPDSGFSENSLCQSIHNERGRSFRLVAQIMWPNTFRYDSLCGKDGAACRASSRSKWLENIEVAERWNDDSDNCERTAFIAYEYSSMRMGSNLHRNVIFRNNVVLPRPVSYIEAPREWQLWEMLKSGCIDSGSGCDVLSIPHNANISNGRMFNIDYIGAGSDKEQIARNKLRIELEPIIEVMQHKGDSECRNGVAGVLGSEDELCDFEKFEAITNAIRWGAPEPDAKDRICNDGLISDFTPRLGPSCISHLSYARYALIEGLKEEKRIGVNPFKFGLSAATDTHNGLGGGVEERSYPGHLGIGDDTVADRSGWTTKAEGNTANNPGGLFGVWAEQNNRDAIFDAMQRKEVFGTSGPRIKPRLFGAFEMQSDLCDYDARIEVADRVGVPMGGDLQGNSTSSAPVFLIEASADPGTENAPGMPLQQLQMIKGWVDSEGRLHSKVYEVAGDAGNGAAVNTETCETSGVGFKQLCSVWRDPEFDPEIRAVYYMRAVENPSCRYNAWQCAGLSGEERPASCDDDRSPKAIQERAWTSPIWYTPTKF